MKRPMDRQEVERDTDALLERLLLWRSEAVQSPVQCVVVSLQGVDEAIEMAKRVVAERRGPTVPRDAALREIDSWKERCDRIDADRVAARLTEAIIAAMEEPDADDRR